MEKEYLSTIFNRCILAIIGSRTPPSTTYEKGVLDEIVLRTENYLTSLTNHLSRITAQQRRSKPIIDDLALLMFLNEINILDLEQEAFKFTPQMEETSAVNTLNSLYFDPDLAPISSDQQPFFEQNKQLVPSERPRPSSIPDWMPEFPPNHTYMHTPSHSSTIRDLRHVRLELVDEGRKAEKALQRMLGDKGSASIIELRKASEVKITEPVKPPSEPLNKPNEPNEPPNEPPLKDQPPTNNDPEKPKLKFKIHLPKPEEPKLKLSLQKPKKKKEVSIVGKRPRVDILKLAEAGGEIEKMEVEVEGNAFARALESVKTT